jgi:hypothetical protein
MHPPPGVTDPGYARTPERTHECPPWLGFVLLPLPATKRSRHALQGAQRKKNRLRCPWGWRVRDENKMRLDDAMAGYEKRLVEMRRRHARAHERHDVFIAEFEQLIDSAIRPAMEDVGAALREHGHDCEISSTQGYSDTRGRTRRTQITFCVYPAGIERSLFCSTNTPHIAFAADWLDRRVAVLESTLIPVGASDGRSGRRAAYTVKQLTREAIEREIVEVLADVIGT